MKVIELLKETDPMDIYFRLGVSIATNEKDDTRQRKEFMEAYHGLISRDVAENDYIIYTLFGVFYEQPAGTSLDSFMIRKTDIPKYQQYNELEQFMLSDNDRNKRIARYDVHKIKELIENTPLPEFVDIRLAPWNDILGAECIIDNGNKGEIAACIVDLMMSFNVDEEKSHQSVKKIDAENQKNPLTLSHRRKISLARHLYQYKVLQTLSHRGLQDGTV